MSAYSVRPGYDRNSRLVPAASNPPPAAAPRQAPKRPMPATVARSSPRTASSPYGVTPGYDAGARTIPRAAAPPRVAQAPASSRGRAIAAAPPMRAPPQYMPQAARIPQAWQPSAPRWEEPEPEMEMPPAPLRITLDPDAAFVADGLLENAPVIYFDSRLSYLTGSVSYLLHELVEDPASDIALVHDADWDQFPEVGDAIRLCGGEEASMCIASCASVGAWGVGVGGQWKKRENVAKLALCVALVENHENAYDIFEQYPEFAEFCNVRPGSKKRRKKAVAKANIKAKNIAHPVAPAAMTEPNAFPKDVPIWIALNADELMPEQLTGLLPEALAVSSDGTKRKALYNNVDQVLSSIMPDHETEIEYHDDADWKLFPTVGAALKEIAPREECMCVAVCPSRSTWAVGVGMKGKPRYAAAKVAIAATLMWQTIDMGEELPELDSQAMLDFVEEVRATRE